MKEQLEMAISRIKFPAGDSNKAYNMTTRHSCETLIAII